MDKMELLWQFQQEDMKADRIAAGMKHSPARQKAEKAREAFYEQKKRAEAVTEQVSVMADRKDAVKDAITHCAEQLSALKQRLEKETPADVEEIRALIAEAERYRKTIADYEQEMNRLSKQSSEVASRLQKISLAAAQAKQDFEKFKKEYQTEQGQDSSAQKAELEQQRAVAKELGDQVPKELMDEYLSIKKHILPPLAKLIGGACSGCNTSQPSALLAKINAGNEIVECETCGRMLIHG